MSSDQEHELTRVQRQEYLARLQAELGHLRGRRARTRSPGVRARLDERIRIAEGRIYRAQTESEHHG